ncbi:DUF4232 domain-containing protein [Streptomyces celluloflavus]|uniref:DUF4232 domain-containing protein n=1 Tax=Streptomyces celluloflavus TaxID=58344 RepID=A0ABW7RJY7_9ACTN
MRKNHIRTTALAATALVAALSLTACQDKDTGDKDTGAAQVPSAAASAAGEAAAPESSADTGRNSAGTGSGHDSAKGSEAEAKSGKSGKSGSGSGTVRSSGSGDKSGYGQVCGANDISWSTRSESQAGGYILIMAKARPGITCSLPAALPVVAFGSDGTEAGPAEQSVGQQVTLSGGTIAYAGVNPKTTNNKNGKELKSIIVGVGKGDPNPVSLPVDAMTVDEPIVTNWHTSAKDAVPFDGVDSH